MIETIYFKFGATDNGEPLSVTPSPVTVFVGPNNAGKSKVLREIEDWCNKGHGSDQNVIIDGINFRPWSEDRIRALLGELKQIPRENENPRPEQMVIGKVSPQTNREARAIVPIEALIRQAVNPNQDQLSHLAQLFRMFTARLDGKSRLQLLEEQPAGDLQELPNNHLSHLFVNDNLREKVRSVIFDAFNKYLVIDPTNVGKLRVRLSDIAPNDNSQEKNLDTDSVRFHGNANKIDDASDGVRAFCGIIVTLEAGDPRITLIDEPEAFLHPALSYKLANAVARSVRGADRRLFAATHSASFVMGCIQSGTPINIIRLTYNYDTPTARILPQEKLLHLMRNPLLRSTGILNGLFYEHVIVTEGDSDRAFYQEVNERLLSQQDERGIPSCLFLNAQNKHTVWDIVRPLRELGIPAAGVVDIDVLKEGGANWSKVLNGGNIPEINHRAFQEQRRALLEAFQATDRNFKRDGGKELLQPRDREAFSSFASQLSSYGVFIVDRGELESWLPELEVTGQKSQWLIDVFEKMGEDPDDPDYVKPANGDVWNFLGQIRSWITNPNRAGIPT